MVAPLDDLIATAKERLFRTLKLDEKRIPDWFEYDQITGLRYEACFKLNQFRPQTLGQASRIDGVTPADMALIMVYLERARGMAVE